MEKNISQHMAFLEKTMKSRPITLLHQLGIELLEIKAEKVSGKMPVDERTHQLFGLLHGGASVALSETLCSIGAFLNVQNPEREATVGLEINANHIRSIQQGWVIAEAIPLHLGSRTQVWSCEIRDEKNRLLCISRCTLATIERKN